MYFVWTDSIHVDIGSLRLLILYERYPSVHLASVIKKLIL